MVSAGGGSEIFMTELAVVTLRENCTSNMIDGAKVKYAAGSWRTFGTTGDDGAGTGSVSKELFPGNRKITLTYNYRSNTITHNLTTDFDFVAVPLTLIGVQNAKYAGGSWRTFTLPTMNQLPGTIKFNLDGVITYITVDANNCTQSYEILTLLDENGNGVPGGKAQPACGGSWQPTLSGQTDNNGKLITTEIPSCFTKIRMTVNQGSVEQLLAALNASNYTWTTEILRIWLVDNAGAPITDQLGVLSQGGGYWYNWGNLNASGYLDIPLFARAGAYKFKMVYNSKSVTKFPVVSVTAGIQDFMFIWDGAILKQSGITPDYTTLLNKVYPNPFVTTTTLEFSLEKEQKVVVAVYDITGKLITTLVDQNLTEGDHKVTWNSQDQYSGFIQQGVYIIKLITANSVKQKTIVKMR